MPTWRCASFGCCRLETCGVLSGAASDAPERALNRARPRAARERIPLASPAHRVPMPTSARRGTPHAAAPADHRPSARHARRPALPGLGRPGQLGGRAAPLPGQLVHERHPDRRPERCAGDAAQAEFIEITRRVQAAARALSRATACCPTRVRRNRWIRRAAGPARAQRRRRRGGRGRLHRPRRPEPVAPTRVGRRARAGFRGRARGAGGAMRTVAVAVCDGARGWLGVGDRARA